MSLGSHRLHFVKRRMKWQPTQPPYNLSPLQPILGGVLFPSNFSRPFQEFVVDLFFAAILRQLLCKSLWKSITEVDALYAALMQQTRARTALCRSGDFASINYHIRLYGVRETMATVAGVGDPGSYCRS